MLSDWTEETVQTNIDRYIEVYNSYNLTLNTMAIGSLDGLYKLFENFRKKDAYLTGSNNQILIVKKKKRAFVFDADLCNASDVEILKELQKVGVIFSTGQLPLPKEKIKEEIVYDIPYVLNTDNYKNSKQRNRKVRRPFKWFNDNNIEITEYPKSIQEVKDLHKDWVTHKKENPTMNTFFFSGSEYLYMLNRFLENPHGINYKALFYYGNLDGEERLLSFRIISLEGEWGYDLLNITRYWCDPNVSNYCYIVGIKYFYDNFGIKYLNCGIFYDAGLGKFKKRYPYIGKPMFYYTRFQEDIPTKKLNEYY